jgi:Ca2+-binding RTX toxin-like protein
MKTEVYTQVFNADGSARTAALQVDTVASHNAVLPKAVAHANVSFSVVFGVTQSTSLFDQVYRQQFTVAGVAVGGNQLVNSNVGEFDQIYVRSTTLTNGTALTMWNSEGSPELAALQGGGFAVTYASESIDSDDEGIALRIFGRGTAGNDVLTVDITGQMSGLGGADRLTGIAGRNHLDGGTGNDRLFGRAGNDTLEGSSGTDVLAGGLDRDTLTGGQRCG